MPVVSSSTRHKDISSTSPPKYRVPLLTLTPRHLTALHPPCVSKMFQPFPSHQSSTPITSFRVHYITYIPLSRPFRRPSAHKNPESCRESAGQLRHRVALSSRTPMWTAYGTAVPAPPYVPQVACYDRDRWSPALEAWNVVDRSRTMNGPG